MTRVRARGAAAALLLLAGGCGYSSSRLVEVPGVSSIAVLQFDNRTFRRDLEHRLTRAVAEEVRARTSFRLGSPGTADALLTGTIVSAETRVVAEDPFTGDPVADRYAVAVDARLVDRRSGRVLREWRVAARDEFARDLYGESLEGSGTDAVTRHLAEDVVRGLERPIGARAGASPPPFRR